MIGICPTWCRLRRGGACFGPDREIDQAVSHAHVAERICSPNRTGNQSSHLQRVGSRALGQYPRDMRDPEDMRAHTPAWYEDCSKGWDAKTHMSKNYERTCRRMAHERINC